MEHLFSPAKRSQRHTYGNRGSKRAKVEKERESSKRVHDKRTTSRRPSIDRQVTPEPASASGQTSPATPCKATSTSANTTPSSSPIVTLSIARDVFNMLSPRKAKHDNNAYQSRNRMSSPEESASEDEAISSYASPGLHDDAAVAQLPSKSSFASRMAPKRARPHSKASHPRGASLSASPSSQPNARSSTAHALHRGTDTVLSPTHARSSQKANPWLPSSKKGNEDWPSSIDDKVLSKEKGSTSDIRAMKNRWSTLDEMEEEDDPKEKDELQNQVKSITNLRSAGELRRFMDDYDYLILDLNSNQRLSARQRSCATIAKRAAGWDENEADTEIQHWQPPPARLTPFVLNIGVACVVQKLLMQMLEAGAGKGEDATMDLALAFTCHRIATSGICSGNDFARSGSKVLTALRCILCTTYPAEKSSERYESLKALSKSCKLTPSYLDDGTPNVVACQMLSLLFSNAKDSNLNEQGEREKFALDFWTRFTSVDFHSTESVACADISIRALSQMNGDLSFLTTRELTWPDTVIKQIQTVLSLETTKEHKGYVDILSSCMRFLVISTQGRDMENSIALGSNSNMAPMIAQTIITSVQNGQKIGQDDIRGAQWMDVAALGLGILTNLLEKVAETTVVSLCRHPHLLQAIGRLYRQQSEQSDDGQAVILSGCIAVALSLLILSSGEEGVQENVIEKIKVGVGLCSKKTLCTKIAAGLDHFADFTSMLKSTSTATATARASMLSAPMLTKEREDNLVRQLSSHICQLSDQIEE